MDSRYLTQTQLALYDFLANFFRRERRWPKYTEIKAHFGWRSHNSVARKLKFLVEKGYLAKDEKGYKFTEKIPGKTDIPASVLEHNNEETEEA